MGLSTTDTPDDFWVQRGDAMGNAGDKRINAIRERHAQTMAGRDFERRTDAIYFNDLGIDAIIGDEMHAYKNLYAAKNRFGQQPKFLGGQGLSNRALDMFFKSRWVRENNGGNNVYGLSATPTKNSPLEIYSMLSHIAPEAFERIGIRNSEEFLDRFCEFRDENILTTKGTIESAMVTAGFKNMDELREIMRRYIDRKTAEDVGLQLPARDDRQHLVDMSAQQREVYEHLREQAELSKNKDGPHIFSVMDKMAKAALDLELYDKASYAGAVSPKYRAAAAQIIVGAADGGQVVFCDSVDAHEKIAKALVEGGIARDQIGIINAQVSASSAARQNIADAFNTGKLKVVIGNTATMGEGINLQKGTTDIHHLDLPWEPASMQQRNGRGLRQGNLKESVRIHTYLAKGSFDGYRHQSMRAKKDWQDLLWSGGDRIENLAREGALSRDDMMIMLSADPDKAREELTKNKAAAEAKFAAAQTADAVAEFARLVDMRRSLAKLKDQSSAAAERLKVRVARLRTALEANPWFKAKAALSGDKPVMVHPTTGEAFYEGVAYEIPANDQGKGGGKFVVTGVEKHASLGALVTVRPYATLSGKPTKVELKDLDRAAPFDYSEDAENAEFNSRFKGDSKEAVANIRSYEDLQSLPASVIEASYDAVQNRIKDGLKDYSFTVSGYGYGSMGMIRDGRPVLVERFEMKDKPDHDVLLPTPAHREAVIGAYLESERGKSYGYEYASTGRRGSGSERRFAAKYENANGYMSATSNPWASIGNAVFGKGFEADAKARFHREQQRAAANAKTLGEAISHLAPTAVGHHATGERIPKKSLAMLWSRAKRTGVLDTPMAQHVPAGRNYGGLFSTFRGYQMSDQEIGDRSVRDVLVGVAQHAHPDLAAAMLSSGDHDPEKAATAMLKLSNAAAIRDGLAHLASRHPHMASRKVGEFGAIEPEYQGYGGSGYRAAHPLHSRYGAGVKNMTLAELAAQGDDRDD